jgi:hypothetical protein
MRIEPHTPLRATRRDTAALAAVLARAFLDDPVARWSCRADGLRMGVLQRFNEARLRQLLAHEEVWTTPDLSCAALWAPPGRWKTTAREDWELARVLLHPRLIPRAPLVVSGLVGIERRHPSEVSGGARDRSERAGAGSRLGRPGTCAGALRRGWCWCLFGVLEGAQHQLLCSPRVPRDGRDSFTSRPKGVAHVA